jgi:hypothetical protein
MQATCRSILDRGGQGIEPGTGPPTVRSAGSPSSLSTILRERTLLTRGRAVPWVPGSFSIAKFHVGLASFFLDTGVWFLADSRVHWDRPPHCPESLQAGARLDASTLGVGGMSIVGTSCDSDQDLNSDRH